MTKEKVRWGILGPGKIAAKFAAGLKILPDAELTAVGSRSKERAETFGKEWNVPRRHTSYEALAADPDVDIVYVATPHVFHKTHSLLCLDAGKAVLCEKPFTINAREAAEVVGRAREKKLFLMEAMWSRFVPAHVEARKLLDRGVIGEPRMLAADFGFRAQVNPQGRLFAPELGGGALLDVGVYPVSLASMIFGEPQRTATLATLGETGVDEQCAAVLGWDNGALAVVRAAVRTTTAQEAEIAGTEGQLRLHSPWWRADKVSVVLPGKEPLVVERPYEGNGYECEAAEAGARLRAGEIESPLLPLDETVAVMRTLDRLRAAWGLKYPGE